MSSSRWYLLPVMTLIGLPAPTFTATVAGRVAGAPEPAPQVAPPTSGQAIAACRVAANIAPTTGRSPRINRLSIGETIVLNFGSLCAHRTLLVQQAIVLPDTSNGVVL